MLAHSELLIILNHSGTSKFSCNTLAIHLLFLFINSVAGRTFETFTKRLFVHGLSAVQSISYLKQTTMYVRSTELTRNCTCGTGSSPKYKSEGNCGYVELLLPGNLIWDLGKIE